MIGLVLKDILVLRKAIRIYIAMLVFYLILTLSGAFDEMMMTGFISLFTMMLPISSFSYDELARWDKFAAALPVSRRGIVGSKYLLAFLLGVIAEALIAVTAVILSLIKHAAPGEILLTGLVCVAIGLLMNSILLPLLFKFGAEKGRLLTMAVIAVIFLIGFGGARLLGGNAVLRALARYEAFLPPVIIAVLAAALFVSFRISLGIYGKKEL